MASTLELLKLAQEALAAAIADQELIAKEEYAKGLEAGKAEGLEAGKAIGLEEGKVMGFESGVKSRDEEVAKLVARIAELESGGEKKYTQAELDQAVNDAVQPLSDRIAELVAKVAELEVKLKELEDNKAKEIEDAINLAKVELKASILAKYKEAQDKETELEKALESELS